MSAYTIAEREKCQDWMEGYEGFGEMRSYTAALEAEQVALTWRTMPPGTGGRAEMTPPDRRSTWWWTVS